MNEKLRIPFLAGTNLALLVLIACLSSLLDAQPITVATAKMPRLGTVSERFQSLNVEMVEVTGGRFWAPYKSASEKKEAAPAANPSGPAIDPSLFRTRPPIDLGNPRLRKLAAALGPAYVRVSGTWANSTYFHDSDDAPPATPPPGFGGVLTRAQWRGVIDFSRAVNAQIVTSFAISDGVRDADGVWTPKEALKVVNFTKAAGGSIAAAEMFNEPSFASMGGAPKGYDARAYGRDFVAFRAFAKTTMPDMLILGPGSLGEATSLTGAGPSPPMLKTQDMLTAAGRGLDAFSYHFYGAASQRCSSMGGGASRTPEAALSEDWLSRTAHDEAFYAALRDRFEPGRPMWLTETGETGCGGNPWASTFVDSFRYLNQLGLLAKRGVQVVAHNTLAASDYGMIAAAQLLVGAVVAQADGHDRARCGRLGARRVSLCPLPAQLSRRRCVVGDQCGPESVPGPGGRRKFQPIHADGHESSCDNGRAERPRVEDGSRRCAAADDR